MTRLVAGRMAAMVKRMVMDKFRKDLKIIFEVCGSTTRDLSIRNEEDTKRGCKISLFPPRFEPITPPKYKQKMFTVSSLSVNVLAILLHLC
jgi:hypothetical protein